jgi:hypothetical protein
VERRRRVVERGSAEKKKREENSLAKIARTAKKNRKIPNTFAELQLSILCLPWRSWRSWREIFRLSFVPLLLMD